MGNRGRGGHSMAQGERVSTSVTFENNPPTNMVLGNPNWVVGANPVPHRAFMYGQVPFNSENFGSNYGFPKGQFHMDEGSNSSMPSLRRLQSSPRYETWNFFPQDQQTTLPNG